jgi:1,4-alpha-glucan branching enzyme
MVSVQRNYVEFSFFRPKARDVYLVGDFNDCLEGRFRMVPSADGYWFTAMRLSAGIYRFRYLADNEWFADYAAFGVECDGDRVNSVLRVVQANRNSREQALPSRRSAKRLPRPSQSSPRTGVAAIRRFQDRQVQLIA